MRGQLADYDAKFKVITYKHAQEKKHAKELESRVAELVSEIEAAKIWPTEILLIKDAELNKLRKSCAESIAKVLEDKANETKLALDSFNSLYGT